MIFDLTQLEQHAIKAAIGGKWNEAINLNQQIIKEDSKKLNAQNRLGIAYLKLEDLKKAKEVFQKILKIDSSNVIAQKNLQKIKNHSSSKNAVLNTSQTISFIEEPGVSRVIPLIKEGEPQVISSLEIGQEVFLKPSARKIKVNTEDKKYVGSFADNISLQLIKFLKSGYKYQALIKSIEPKNLKVFIQETKRSKRLKGIPTFNSDNSFSKSINLPVDEPKVPPLEMYDPLTSEE